MTNNETLKETFTRLQAQLGEKLQELHTLFATNNAPEEVTYLFSLAIEDHGTIRGLIDQTLEDHPVSFLK
jgi:hypothetical protein